MADKNPEKKIQFKDKSIELAIVDFYSLEFVEYREDQSHIVKFIAELLHKRLSINDLAMQGFIMRAIRKWQIESGIKVSQLLTKAPKERILNVGLMFENLRTELRSVLKNSNTEDLLDEAIEEAFKAYIDNYSNRKSKLY